jgi:hypothetical protein
VHALLPELFEAVGLFGARAVEEAQSTRSHSRNVHVECTPVTNALRATVEVSPLLWSVHSTSGGTRSHKRAHKPTSTDETHIHKHTKTHLHIHTHIHTHAHTAHIHTYTHHTKAAEATRRDRVCHPATQTSLLLPSHSHPPFHPPTLTHPSTLPPSNPPTLSRPPTLTHATPPTHPPCVGGAPSCPASGTAWCPRDASPARGPYAPPTCGAG